MPKVDPAAAARERLEAVVLDQARHRDRDRERGQREVEAGQAQRRKAEEEAGDPGDGPASGIVQMSFMSLANVCPPSFSPARR